MFTQLTNTKHASETDTRRKTLHMFLTMKTARLKARGQLLNSIYVYRQ